MSSKFQDRYKTDKSLEEQGVWVALGDGIEIKVARMSSERSQAVRRRLEKPYAKIRNNLPEDIVEKLIIQQLAEAVLLDWKGVDGEDGKPLECSIPNKVKVLTEYKDFTNDVITCSAEKETFKAQATEEVAKN